MAFDTSGWQHKLRRLAHPLQPLIDSGRLRRVLPDWNTPHLPIHAVYPTRRHLSAKVQAMASFLKDWFAAQ